MNRTSTVAKIPKAKTFCGTLERNEQHILSHLCFENTMHISSSHIIDQHGRAKKLILSLYLLWKVQNIFLRNMQKAVSFFQYQEDIKSAYLQTENILSVEFFIVFRLKSVAMFTQKILTPSSQKIQSLQINSQIENVWIFKV